MCLKDVAEKAMKQIEPVASFIDDGVNTFKLSFEKACIQTVRKHTSLRKVTKLTNPIIQESEEEPFPSEPTPLSKSEPSLRLPLGFAPYKKPSTERRNDMFLHQVTATLPRYRFMEFAEIPGILWDESYYQGGQSNVLIRKHADLGKVAVKLFHTKNEKHVMFLREIRNISKVLSHPGVVHIHGLIISGQDDNVNSGYVMEYIDTSLEKVIFNKNLETNSWEYQYSLHQAVDWMANLAACLQFLHDVAVLHRDLKPENLLIKWNHPKKPIKVCDFGLSKDVNTSGNRMTTLPATPGYAAPEMANGDAYNEAVDVFSFAVIFAELLLRRRVFEEDIQAVDVSDYPALRSIVERCSSMNGDLRPTMKELKEELLKLLNEHPEWQEQPIIGQI